VETLNQASADAIRLHKVTADLFGLFRRHRARHRGHWSRWHPRFVGKPPRARNRDPNGARCEACARTRMIIGQGMTFVVIGLALGWAGAVFLTRALAELLFKVTPTDPATFWGVSFLFLCAALIACYIPARRAVRIDPIVALRST